MLSESIQTQKATYHIIPFIGHSRKDNYSNREQISACQSWGWGEGLTIKGPKRIFGGDEFSVF